MGDFPYIEFMKPFEDLFKDAVRHHLHPKRTPPEGECRTRPGALCPLCFAGILEYEQESSLRNLALQEWWRGALPGKPLEPLVRSPQGRYYRSVTKRKAFRQGRSVVLGLINPDAEHGDYAIQIPRCAIEPLPHNALYEHIAAWLAKPVATPLHDVLQYVIIKGDDHDRIVVLNVSSTDAGVVRAGNTLSKSVTAFDPRVRGFFLYEDESGGRYYFGMQGSGAPGRLQRLFGAETLSHKTAGKRFVYPLLAFSQINHSMLETLVSTVSELLGLPCAGTLFDLYCGYGLFGIAMADQVKRVVGVDLAPVSIEAAQRIAQHLHLKNVRFHRNNLTTDSLAQLLERSGPEDRVILDPPRGGTAEGVIEVIAGRQVHRVVHLFCNIDILVREVERWEKAGYRMERAVPLDMFPGTSTVEVAGLFTREG